MLNLSSVTQRKFPCVAPAALPLPAAGPPSLGPGWWALSLYPPGWVQHSWCLCLDELQGLVSLSLQQQRVLLSLLSGLCFSGSVRRQKVLGKVKGLSWRVFPHSEAHVDDISSLCLLWRDWQTTLVSLFTSWKPFSLPYYWFSISKDNFLENSCDPSRPN